ncbi:zf-TFIIB domain-containing protein [Hyalangium rubrum]|uniref:Zf-TFIIB domain-containing protein n=1 Tax=Hyalangium rubrum TaxID=3103134 RepID=A0ABU5HAY1_9BACT|nr:zf-TFIIB domain-containing protein [Hyalangium sp. s54d21]MDY7230629.1 zf-TFIIB domain-containing protein [Hyalangium sp. s54d21]
MASCPFCYGTLLPTFSNGLQREKCGRCSALWFEGEALAKVMGGSATDALIARARGKHGQCKGCKEPLEYVPQCSKCGHAAPTCPHCGTAPLSVAVVHGIEVDVCPDCRGVALDKGELEHLQQEAEQERDGGLDLKPKLEPQNLQKPQCMTCKRKLKLEHAFVYDTRLYCGSCAPQGSAPYSVELARASPSLQPTVGTYLQGGGGWTAADPISYAIGWLFSSMLD